MENIHNFLYKFRDDCQFVTSHITRKDNFKIGIPDRYRDDEDTQQWCIIYK